MVVRLRVAMGALLLLVGAVGEVVAQPHFLPKPTDALPASTGMTYLDLLQFVVPGISVDGGTYSGGRPINLRHLHDQGSLGDVEIPRTGPLKLAAVPVRSGGRDRMALLVDFGATEDGTGLAVLALFDITGAPRLLDAADIAADRWTSFIAPVRLSAGPGDDLLVTQSTHSNSSQSYAIASLVLVRDDRLGLIDTIAYLSDRACTFERRQNLTITQGEGEPIADVVATVTELTTPTGEDCNGQSRPEPGSRTITVTYRWDSAAQRYVPTSDAFTSLARENEKRF